jgi:hypothetical protein
MPSSNGHRSQSRLCPFRGAEGRRWTVRDICVPAAASTLTAKPLYHTTHTRSPREVTPTHKATAASPLPHIPALDLPHAQAHPPQDSHISDMLTGGYRPTCPADRTAGPASAQRAVPARRAAPPPGNNPQRHTNAQNRASRKGPRWPAHPPPTRGEHPHAAPPAAAPRPLEGGTPSARS